MKNRVVFFLLPFFIGGAFSPLSAMLPNKTGRRETAEKKGATMIEGREQKMRASEDDDLSSSLERGESFEARERDLTDEEYRLSETADISLAALAEKLKEAQESQRYWSAQQDAINHPDQTISATDALDLLAAVRKRLSYWNSEKKRYEEAAEQSGELARENNAALTAVLGACDENVEILKNTENPLQKRTPLSSGERAKEMSYDIDKEGEATDPFDNKYPSTGRASSPPREDRAASFSQEFLTLEKESHSVVAALSLEQLRTNAKLLRNRAESLQANAERAHNDAQEADVRCYFNQAREHYENAIDFAQKTAEAWARSEEAHLQVMQVSGEKIRQWGKKLKNSWAAYAQTWQEELELFKNSDPLQRAVRVKARREEFLEKMRRADGEERNEIGETYDSIARKLEVIEKHLNKIAEAHAEGDDVSAKSFEAKIAILEGRIVGLESYLDFLIDAMQKWKRDYQTEESRYLERQEEPQADGGRIVRHIYKRRFVGPLLLIERRFDAEGHILTENKMAAEYLMVQLDRLGESQRILVNRLREDFPNNNVRIEEVSRNSSLYSLHFEISASDTDPAARLNLFANIKKTIEVKNLAADCYPSTLLRLASSKSSQSGVPVLEEEPWHLKKAFGIHPPVNLFDDHNPAIPPSSRSSRDEKIS